MKYEDKFKEIRKRLHLTQQKFAEGIEVEKSHIGQIETGKRQPGIKTIQKICSAYDIDPREFFERKQRPAIKTKNLLTIKTERMPKDKQDLLLKRIALEEDMNIEEIRNELKHTEKEKLWKKISKRKKSKAG